MQAGDGLRKGTGFDRADQRQEESSQGTVISVVSNVMQTDGLLSPKQKGTMLPIFKSIQCSCDKGGTIVFVGFGGGRQCLRDEKNAASGSKGTFCNAKGKKEEKYGHWNGSVWVGEVIPVFAGIHRSSAKIVVAGRSVDDTGDPKMYRGKWEKAI